jgi:hypothetical protein
MTHDRNAPHLNKLDLMMLSRFGQCPTEKAAAAERAMARAQEPSWLRIWIATSLRIFAQKLDARPQVARSPAQI